MSRRNRRQFLEDSMLAAAAAVTAGSAGDGEGGQEPGTWSPNARLGVAVVGVRGRGASHIGAFAGRKDTEVLYVCDVDHQVGARRAAEVAKRQRRRPRLVEDLREALDDRRVDLVSIATPNHLHAMQAIWAMQADRDVYLEKPVSHNVSEGRRIVEAARKYRRICQTGTQCRSNAGMIAAMRFLHAGKLGAVQVARGLCYKQRLPIGPWHECPVPSSVNYDLWLGPAPVVPVTRPQFHHAWHWQWEYGNGDLGNQGVHQMDLARWGLGVQELSRSVVSYGGRLGGETLGETADTQVVLHDYGRQLLVFEVRGLSSGPHRGVRVGVIFECAGGYLVVPRYDTGAAFDLDGTLIRKFAGGGDHFANFLKAVRSRRVQDLNADVEEGHLSSALCHLGNISYRLGDAVPPTELKHRLASLAAPDHAHESLRRTLRHLAHNNVALDGIRLVAGPQLTFDPCRETFLDHEVATRMLTRDYRAPYVVPDRV
jgi:predicted dehydrogenase